MITTADVKCQITFVWHLKDRSGILKLHDITVEYAKEVAQGFGWTERCWYKPTTWKNRVEWIDR